MSETNDWVDDFLDELNNDPQLQTYAPDTWAPSWSANDGNAGESAASSYVDNAKSNGSYWGNDEYSGPMSLFWDGEGAAAQGVNASLAQAYEDRGLDFKGLGSARYEAPKDDTNVLDRIKSGAKKAWDKDPLEVLKFGANAIGGAVAADRQNKLAQAQIDAYNARLQQEKDNQARIDNSIASYKRKGKGYSGPLKNVHGQRVFNDNGTAKR
jgi:hypothetical protein